MINLLSKNEIKEIENNSLLSSIPSEEILEIGEIEEFFINDMVAHETLPPKGLGFVLEGLLICENKEGKKVARLNKFLPGSVFGVASLFDSKRETYVSCIYSKKQSKVLWIREDKIQKLIQNNPEFALEYVKFLTSKIRFLNMNIGRYTSKNAEESLLEYLKTVCKKENDFSYKLNVAKVARDLAVTRPSIYSSVEKLLERGVIEKKGDIIIMKEDTQ